MDRVLGDLAEVPPEARSFQLRKPSLLNEVTEGKQAENNSTSNITSR
jgi:hypothetical protein